ncbi:MAG TPA: lytic transglycosylase domain-containing protein [Caulobacteraceae bacterium]|nr:lytic transglycosylase domain-containing protein [Caulobacteraceae bacterium]
MRLIRGILAFSLTALPGIALAAPPPALSAHDAALYAAAFSAAERGDVAGADASLAQVSDNCLAGDVQYVELTQAKARTASYDELASWLRAYGDRPGAGRVYELAVKRKPADAPPPELVAPPVETVVDGGFRAAPAPQSRAAREAFYNGDVRRGLDLARASGDAWIAGLAAYRLGDYPDALVSFETLAANPAEDNATRAAGGYWAARAAVAAGMPERANAFLKIAAGSPGAFYGMIAQRKLELADDPLGRLIDAATSGQVPPPTSVSNAPASGETALDRLIRIEPRARRAVALSQLGRSVDARAELRAGYAEAADDGTRALWMGLMYELDATSEPASGRTGEIVLHSAVADAGSSSTYPTPSLSPAGGFTADKALVYAVIWQESRFNSIAVSPVGAVGLMQLMPTSAASVAGDPTLTSDPISLFDTGKNMALGQAYLNQLEDQATGHDILRTVAGYNGGPATVARTEAMLGPDADTLLVIESLPYAETRAYVKKVMAAYWTYRRQFGAPTRTLDAVASDLPTIDARLDASAPAQNPQTTAAAPRQALEILLSRGG